MKRLTRALAVLLVSAAAFSFSLAAQQAADGPRYTNGTSLIRPTNYREWPFVGSSLGLAYTQLSEAAQSAPPFANVFVNPSSYRSFMQTGKWPDGTMLVLEVRRSTSDGALIKGGRYQTPDILVLEAQVKDARFPDGWAFFSWGPGRALKDVADPAPATAAVKGEGTCVECHTKHAAVERTFVQYYPTLLEVARQKGTLNTGF
jgi:hypothetical protein